MLKKSVRVSLNGLRASGKMGNLLFNINKMNYYSITKRDYLQKYKYFLYQNWSIVDCFDSPPKWKWIRIPHHLMVLLQIIINK